MHRRTFLKWQLGGFAWAATGMPSFAASTSGSSGSAGAVEWPDVSIVKGGPAAATRTAVTALGGMERFVGPGQSVLIKPNMSFALGPESAANTHPDVVRELVILCREAGAGKVRVLDHPLQNASLSLERSGILAACESVMPGICHQVTDASFYVTTALEAGKDMRENAIMRDALEADVLIAAPVAKSHGGAGVSLSLKGQMGLIYDRYCMHSRYDLHTAIVDLNTRIKPHLVVIDATRVLASGGPGGPGTVLTPGEIIASADPVAADATAVASYRWYDREILPRQVASIRQAHERGLGRMDIENLNTVRLTA